MTSERNFSAVPAAALRFAGGEVSLGDNGDGAKTAPVKLKARSGQPIEHWFWGKVVHDLSGMRMHKPRLTIDYAHNDAEVLGYLNHFETESGDLVASGALTPFKADDRASEVLFKMKQGVPYEASIFFGGDGIKVEEVGEGMVAQVNGYQFAGPGIIVREWPLRGVAICPYGADANTDSSALASGESYAVSKVVKEDVKMSEVVEAKPVEVEAKAEEKPGEPAPVEAAAVEAEGKPAVEMSAPPASAEVVPPVAVAQVAEDVDKFNVLEAEFATAKAEVESLKVERDELAKKLAAAQALAAGPAPVSAVAVPKDGELSPWQKAVLAGRKSG